MSEHGHTRDVFNAGEMSRIDDRASPDIDWQIVVPRKLNQEAAGPQ
jgi:hypothetical protein